MENEISRTSESAVVVRSGRHTALVRLPVPGGVTRRDGADDLDHAEEDGDDAQHHDDGGEGAPGVPDAQEPDRDGEHAADQVHPPVRKVVVPQRRDDVEDAQHEERPADEHGDDEDRDVGPDEAHDAGTDPEQAEDEVDPPVPGHADGSDDLEDPSCDEETTGEVDRGVDGGVAPADDEESEDHGDDASGQVPAPHLLELFGDYIAGGDVIFGQHVRHLESLLGE